MIETENIYQSVIDVAGAVGQFLLNVTDKDLITELIQNELDGGSAFTRLSVFPDRIICEGNGDPIDEKGWERLAYTLGAGGYVEAKIGGFGAKNHGLRVALRISDLVVIQSAGLRTQLTTRANPARGFSPGAMKRPVEDPEAPEKGVRVTIFFRKKRLLAKDIDGLELPVFHAEDADELVRFAISEAPRRFLAVTHPKVRRHYTIEVVPQQGITVQIHFSCRWLHEMDGYRLLERSVEISEDGNDPRMINTERVVRFSLKGAIRNRRVPNHFRETLVFGEISWSVDKKGQPKMAIGTLRYPISYPDNITTSDTGLSISAPFVSDPPRHKPADGDPTNANIITRAENTAARILARHLIPRYGPAALNLLACSDAPIGESGKRLIFLLAKEGGLPLESKKRVAEAKTNRHPKLRTKFAVGPRKGRPVVVADSNDSAIAIALSKLAPTNLLLLHHATPSFIKAQLCATHQPELYLKFGTVDVIDRFCGMSKLFPWQSEEERVAELADVKRSTRYLYILGSNPSELNSRASDISSRGLLPLASGGVEIWEKCRRSKVDVPNIPAIPPKILHRELGQNKILTNGPTKIPEFNLNYHLLNWNWDNAADCYRRLFLDWLSVSAKRINATTLHQIAKYPVFASTDSTFHRLSDLCLIKGEKLRRLLANHIHTPSAQVIKLTRFRQRGLSLRSVPTTDEVLTWYREGMASLGDRATVLDTTSLAKLDAIEEGMKLILSSKELHAIANDMRNWDHWSANRVGIIRPVRELHLATDNIFPFELSAFDILGGRHNKLYEYLNARHHPSISALLRAISECATDNEVIFFIRLNA